MCMVDPSYLVDLGHHTGESYRNIQGLSVLLAKVCDSRNHSYTNCHLTNNTQLLFNCRTFWPEGLCQLLTCIAHQVTFHILPTQLWASTASWPLLPARPVEPTGPGEPVSGGGCWLPHSGEGMWEHATVYNLQIVREWHAEKVRSESELEED